jgi:PKD repeat protein
MKKLFVLASLLLITITGCINITQPPAAQPATPPVVVTFSASPTEIKTGESATLLWNVTGATSVTIDQGIGDVTVADTKTVSPTKATTYTLTATNSAGTTNQSVTLTVSGVSIITPGLLKPIVPPLVSLQTTVLDLIEAAPNAKWDNFVAEVVLPFPGTDTDNRGFAMYKYNVKMEDGNSYARVLETHPQWVYGGNIFGWYGPLTIPAGSKFIAKVGFLDGAQGTDGVEFRLAFRESTTLKETMLVNVPAKYDGKLTDIDTSLDAIAGKTGQILLVVVATDSPNSDWATWTEAKIIR